MATSSEPESKVRGHLPVAASQQLRPAVTIFYSPAICNKISPKMLRGHGRASFRIHINKRLG